MPISLNGLNSTPRSDTLNALGTKSFPIVSPGAGVTNSTAQAVAVIPFQFKIRKLSVYFTAIDNITGTDSFNIVTGFGPYSQGNPAPNDNSFDPLATTTVGVSGSINQTVLGGVGYPTNAAATGQSVFAADVAFNATNFPGISTGAAPAAPALAASTTGGSLATGTEFVKITYVTATGESAGSAEASVAVTGPTASVTVTSPAAASGATGYNVYASATTGTETLQNAVPIAIGTNYVITTNAAGRTTPTVSTSGGAVATFVPTNYDAVYLTGTPITLRATTVAGTGSISNLLVTMAITPIRLRPAPPGAQNYAVVPGVDY